MTVTTRCIESLTGRDIGVRLEGYEIASAAYVGIRRHTSALLKGKRDAYGFDGSDGVGWSRHIEGAAGEMAFAKAAGVYWDHSVDTFKRPDFVVTDLRIHVRTRSGIGDRTDLIVRPDEPTGDIYVLVIGEVPTFRVVGWTTGYRAKDEALLRDHGNRPEAYFVPPALMWDFPIDLEAH